MTDIFRPKTINVPGLLSDSALQEQLKQLASEMNTQQAAAPMPSSAVEMADKIQNQFLNVPKQVLTKAAPLAAGPLAPLAQAAISAGTRPAPAPQDPALTAQDEAIDVRSDILASGVDAVTPNFLTDIGTLSPEERQAEADKRAKDAASTEGAVLDKAEVRAKLREQAATDKSGLSFMEGVEATDTNQLAENAAQDRRVTDNVQKKTDIAKKAVTDKDLQPTQTWWMNMVQRGIAKVPSALTDAASGAIIAGYEAPRDFFFGGDLGRSDMRAWVQTVDATINKILPGDKARSQDFLTQLAEGGGSMVSYMMGGYIARAIGMPAAAPTAVLGGLGGGANQFEDAERFNATGLQKYMSFVLGAGLGITDAIPIDRMFMGLDAASGGLVMRMLNQTKVGSLTEFIQETGQTFGEDVVAKLLYDAKRELDPMKYLKAGLVGGITGGLAGATTAILDASPATNSMLKVNPKLKAALDALTPDQQQAMIEETITSAQSQIDEIVPDEAAPDEQAAISQPAGIIQGPGGSIPVREDGMFEATHWSRKPLDVIDPAMRGTGSLRGEEQNRIGRVSLGDQPAGNIVDRSYAGVGDPDFREKWQATQAALPKDQRTGMKPTDPYHREGGLGGYRHTIALDPNTIYNWIEDPLKLKDQLDPTAPDNDRTTHYEKLIKDAGFAGAYISEKENMGQTVMLFDKVQPEKVIDEKFGLDPKEIASIDEFKQISPETFKKGGWAVVTGTQEAQGDPLSPANIEANKKLENVLKRNGIKYMVVGGAYDGADQGRSFLIFESEKRAMEIGKRFNQESVLTRDGYKYTDGRITPVDQSKTVVGPEALTRSGYSVMPDGTPFSLGLDFDATYNPDEIAAQYGIDDVMGMRVAGEDVTDTQEFASWFKKSQVVDEFGLPLVVYHSTTYVEDTPTANPYSTTGFSEFNTQSQKHLGAHFGTVEQGATIVDYAGKPAHNSNVYPVYLSVQNPIRLRDEGSWTYSRLRGQLQSVLSSRQIDELDQYITNSDEQLALMREMIKNEGYDGVVYTNRYEGFEVPAGVYSGDTAPDRRNLSDADFAAKYGAQESWIIFEPNQVKSTMNNGDFDSSENDILAMVAKPSRIDKLMDQVPGLKRVAKHMLPDERAKLYKGNASTIVNIFENLPDPSEIASVAFAGRAKKGWYQRSAEALVDIFGIEDAPRFTALLAALSPQTSVENNAITALKVWTAWVRANRPPHADAIKRILAANVQGQNAEKSVLDAWINNSITSLSSPDPSTVVLSGPKVDSFMQNLRGVTNAVTNDAWMANYANIDQKVFAKSGEKAPGKGPGYVAFSARVRAAAALLSKRTGVEWTPAEIQETVWSWAKTLTEMAESKEETRSAVEIIEQSGLTAEQIAATPDFASLFAQGVYAEILKKGGYDVETAGSSGRSDVGDGRASDPASAEGSGVSQSTHDTNIRRAAQRLDALLAKRAEARAIAAEAKRLGKGKKVKGESGNRLAPESESDLDFTPMDQPGDADPLAHLSEDDLKFIDEGGLFGQRSASDPLQQSTGDWRSSTITATLEDDTTVEVEAGGAVDLMLERIKAIREIMDCVNAA